jgi:hypothetical protein
MMIVARSFPDNGAIPQVTVSIMTVAFNPKFIVFNDVTVWVPPSRLIKAYLMARSRKIL